MRKAAFILAVLLLASACSLEFGIGQLGKNPFEDPVDLSEKWEIGYPADGVLQMERAENASPSGDAITFPFVTDVHLRRENEHGNITHYHEEFKAFLHNGGFPFVVCLGDLMDNGSFFQDTQATDYIREVGNLANGNFIYTVGNHDLHSESRKSFSRLWSDRYGEGESATMKHFVYGDLSIYMLDNASRTFGADQLGYLESALKADTRPYRILIAHENVFTGGVFDQTLAIFGAHMREANRLARIAAENGVSLILTGHHHKGDITYQMKGFAEYNAAAAHRHDTFMDLESRGYWYTVEIDPDAGEIRLAMYLAETGERVGTRSFTLNKAR